MVEGSFNQMQVTTAIELGFAQGLRALMHQDPDIIMVGGIRDLESAEMALQAALTGHLVLSTLHTNDAPSAVTPMLELGIASYLLNAALNGIMAQRLVRTLCPHCKGKVALYRGEDHAKRDALVPPWKFNRLAAVYKPIGCLRCRMTGFIGRVGVYETLLCTPRHPRGGRRRQRRRGRGGLHPGPRSAPSPAWQAGWLRSGPAPAARRFSSALGARSRSSPAAAPARSQSP